MTDPTHSKLVRLAEPGELRGFKITGALGEAYREAMSLALDHPEQPVLVEAYDPADGTDAAVEAARTAAQQAAKAALRAVNAADHEDGADPAIERFHVGYSAPPAGRSAFTTYLVFYPGGRPKRQRGATAEGGGEGEGDGPSPDPAD